jgi:hypothetical protein
MSFDIRHLPRCWPRARSHAHQCVATVRGLAPPPVGRSPRGGKHPGGQTGLLAPAREMVERGERLRRRIRATPPGARPDAKDFLPHMPVVLAGLFDSVSVAFASGTLRSYALRAEALSATVQVSATGRWFAADGTAEGSGLISLTMWRADVIITPAVLILGELISSDVLARGTATVPAGGGP